MKKPFPKFKTQKAFKKFFEKEDLGDYLSADDLKPANLHLKSQDQMISIRLSSHLLALLKKAAQGHHTKYQRLIRSILEENVSQYLG
ncbi:MAG: hypothetical protein HY073_03605 [Deltaproteobacteria bacterium]|nr:hypothetical protein [Deltaproteobacteria bacterium]